LAVCTSSGIAIALKTSTRHDGEDALQVTAQRDLDDS
jgi:hypothetical protein